MQSDTVWNGTDCINDVVGVGNNGVVKSDLDVGVFDLERIMFEQTPPIENEEDMPDNVLDGSVFGPETTITDLIPPVGNQDILDYHSFDSKSIPDQGPPFENIAILDRNSSIDDSMEIDLDIDERIPIVDIENHNILESVEISMLDASVCSLSDSVLDDGVGEFVLNSESMFDINPPILDRTPPLLDRTPPLGAHLIYHFKVLNRKVSLTFLLVNVRQTIF